MSNKKNIFLQVRMKLGIVRRKIFKTNHAYWYCRRITEVDNFDLNDQNLKLTFDNYLETTGWTRIHQRSFPWIFNPRQNESAEKHKHFYSSLMYNSNLIGFVKIGVGRVYIEDYEREIDLAKDEAFIYDTFIHPDYRKKHMGSFMLREIINELQNKGFLYVFCHIPDWNVESIGLYKKLGFKAVSNVRYVRLCQFRYFSKGPNKVREVGRILCEKCN